jgi:hypothetical protein
MAHSNTTETAVSRKRGEKRDMRMWQTLLFGFSVLAASSAQASLILDTGLVSFSPTGNQFGRISRDGNSAIWGVAKTFPGVIGAPTTRGYETFTIHNFDRSYIQISLDDPDAVLFDAAYLNIFSPVNVSPNYGLNVNYLGDPGLSEPFGNPSAFQIFVPANSTIVIDINEVNPGGGTGHAFELFVEGFYDANFSDTPEPSSLLLAASAGLFLVVYRYR